MVGAWDHLSRSVVACGRPPPPLEVDPRGGPGDRGRSSIRSHKSSSPSIETSISVSKFDQMCVSHVTAVEEIHSTRDRSQGADHAGKISTTVQAAGAPLDAIAVESGPGQYS